MDPCPWKVELCIMTVQELSNQYIRDLDRLAREISAYKNESVLWEKTGTVNNPAGNLCMHICGNLRHFIGHMIGGSDYQRDRAYEFGCTNLPVAELLKEIDRTKQAVSTALPDLSTEKLAESFPMDVLKHEMTTGYFLLHLIGHLNYHLGQISYHRRLLDTQ